jgi:hypothetical protein
MSARQRGTSRPCGTRPGVDSSGLLDSFSPTFLRNLPWAQNAYIMRTKCKCEFPSLSAAVTYGFGLPKCTHSCGVGDRLSLGRRPRARRRLIQQKPDKSGRLPQRRNRNLRRINYLQNPAIRWFGFHLFSTVQFDFRFSAPLSAPFLKMSTFRLQNRWGGVPFPRNARRTAAHSREFVLIRGQVCCRSKTERN